MFGYIRIMRLRNEYQFTINFHTTNKKGGTTFELHAKVNF